MYIFLVAKTHPFHLAVPTVHSTVRVYWFVGLLVKRTTGLMGVSVRKEALTPAFAAGGKGRTDQARRLCLFKGDPWC
jgi:hypothetical protein